MSHQAKVVAGYQEARALVTVVERMALRDPAQQHGRLLEVTGMRINAFKRLEGRANRMLDQPLGTNGTGAPAEVGDCQDVEVRSRRSQQPHLGECGGGIGPGEVNGFGEDDLQPAQQIAQRLPRIIRHPVYFASASKMRLTSSRWVASR
jgi:hypothetical protein